MSGDPARDAVGPSTALTTRAEPRQDARLDVELKAKRLMDGVG